MHWPVGNETISPPPLLKKKKVITVLRDKKGVINGVRYGVEWRGVGDASVSRARANVGVDQK